MRLLILILVYIVCFLGPNLIHFISFAGALFNSSLGFILPVIVFNSYFKKQSDTRPRKRLVNNVVLVVGSIMSTIAVVDSAYNLFGGGGGE